MQVRLCTKYFAPTPQNNEPVPQVLNKVVNLSCFFGSNKKKLKWNLASEKKAASNCQKIDISSRTEHTLMYSISFLLTTLPTHTKWVYIYMLTLKFGYPASWDKVFKVLRPLPNRQRIKAYLYFHYFIILHKYTSYQTHLLKFIYKASLSQSHQGSIL